MVGGQMISYHVALEEFDLCYDLDSTVVLARHNSLRQEVHRLLDKELFLDGNLSWQYLATR